MCEARDPEEGPGLQPAAVTSTGEEPAVATVSRPHVPTPSSPRGLVARASRSAAAQDGLQLCGRAASTSRPEESPSQLAASTLQPKAGAEREARVVDTSGARGVFAQLSAVSEGPGSQPGVGRTGSSLQRNSGSRDSAATGPCGSRRARRVLAPLSTQWARGDNRFGSHSLSELQKRWGRPLRGLSSRPWPNPVGVAAGSGTVGCPGPAGMEPLPRGARGVRRTGSSSPRSAP